MGSQVRLQWASHQGTVLSVFEALLTTETMVDVTLAADGQYLRAHKIMLSACSPYFQELLSLDLNKSPIIFMKDVKYSDLKALIQFIYRGEVNIAQENLTSFLAVAQALQIRGLASVDPPVNNIESDTLTLPDFNISSSHSTSKHSNPALSSSAKNISYEPEPSPVLMQPGMCINPSKTTPTRGSHNQSQLTAPVSDKRVMTVIPPVLPPPAKRHRFQYQGQGQHDPLDLNPVSIPSSTSSVQTRASMSASESEVFGNVSRTAQITSQFHPTTYLYQNQQVMIESTNIMEEQAEVMLQGEDVKLEVTDGIQVQPTVELGVYGEAEEGDNSMSQSSFTEAWKHEEGESFDEQDSSMVEQDEDHREMPSGSGTKAKAGESGQSSEDSLILKCDLCGRKWPLSRNNLNQYRRHCRFGCPIIPPKFKCRHCNKPIRRSDVLKSHETHCSGGDQLECPNCGQQFPHGKRAKYYYNRHRKFLCPHVQPQFQCKYCQRTIRLKENCMKHEMKCLYKQN